MNWIFERLSPKQKTIIAFSTDAIVALIAFPMAYILRYGQDFTEVFISHQVADQTIIVVMIEALCFYTYGMYRSIWRYASTPDLIRIIKGVSLASLFSLFAIFLYNRLELTPRSIFAINWLLLIIGLGSWRLVYRLLRDHSLTQVSGRFDRVIIIGAGSGGEQLIREIKRTPSLNMKVVGFVDDDPGKKNKLLQGIPIFGNVNELPKIIESSRSNKIIIAIPRATSEQMCRIVEACRNANVRFKTLPMIKDILNGKVELSQLRNVEPEDLLGRQEVNLDENSLQTLLGGSSVMITGAGGSIGSEICRQISTFLPNQVILFEQNEYALYKIEIELTQKFPNINFRCFIGDVRSNDDLEMVFKKFHPDVVFHAAAYKHVPMMERNPAAAIKTNIFGTYTLANKSIEHNVKKFVMISTDKAVNPTSVMGATKRVAEIICEYLQAKTKTQFVIVRFGNVLGSSGSVIPRFKQQLKEGGPLTVTHPEIERYFMSISEASQLVLQAGAIGKGSQIFVLNMGRPVKIVELAKQLIILSGLTLGRDIEISYTGLRPGEKLFEELLFDFEKTLPTLHPMLRVAKAKSTKIEIDRELNLLRDKISNITIDEVKIILKNLVSEYNEPTEDINVNSISFDKTIVIH
ncbi:MAG: polysaccharide biosynthesis protein [Bdellovibrionaceae bacterium]|nr:polysaccharide biosynthesis protein [Pseudobdellovibrionaceae bacterium]